MNMLEALLIVRSCAAPGPQMKTVRGKAALAVLDRKIQSLMRKKAWREATDAEPIHMGNEGFEYAIPDVHPDAIRLNWIENMAADCEGQVITRLFLPDGKPFREKVDAAMKGSR